MARTTTTTTTRQAFRRYRATLVRLGIAGTRYGTTGRHTLTLGTTTGHLRPLTTRTTTVLPVDPTLGVWQ